MKSFKIFLLFIGTVTISAGLFASYTIDDVLRAMEGKEQDVKTMKFDFTQSVQFSGSSLASKASGKAVLRRPNQMQVHQVSPVEQMIVVNGKKSWLYSPTNKQVFVGASAKGVFGQGFAKGFFPMSGTVAGLKKDFNFELKSKEPDANGNLILSAFPKSSDLGYSLELVVSEESWFPLETKITSDSAVVTTQVSEIEVNPDVADEVFNFKAPKGTEVLSF